MITSEEYKKIHGGFDNAVGKVICYVPKPSNKGSHVTLYDIKAVTPETEYARKMIFAIEMILGTSDRVITTSEVEYTPSVMFCGSGKGHTEYIVSQCEAIILYPDIGKYFPLKPRLQAQRNG